jgi:tetratricopeptide (TPR) repeat protein
LIAVVGAIAIGLPLARAQTAEAERRFVKAEALRAAGKIAEACAAFEDSNRIEPSAGTLINIGLCKEQLGKVASALDAFRRALARVKDPKKKAIALQQVAALESRVSYLTIVVAQGSRVAGLVISRDGIPIVPADYDRPIPVDGGPTRSRRARPGTGRGRLSSRSLRRPTRSP